MSDSNCYCGCKKSNHRWYGEDTPYPQEYQLLCQECNQCEGYREAIECHIEKDCRIEIYPNLSGHASGGYEQFYIKIFPKGDMKRTSNFVYSIDELLDYIRGNIGKIVLNGTDDYHSSNSGTQEWNRKTKELEVVPDDNTIGTYERRYAECDNCSSMGEHAPIPKITMHRLYRSGLWEAQKVCEDCERHSWIIPKKEKPSTDGKVRKWRDEPYEELTS